MIIRPEVQVLRPTLPINIWIGTGDMYKYLGQPLTTEPLSKVSGISCIILVPY